jgi:ribonuclease HI
LNFDGTSKGNPGLNGLGGGFYYHHGTILKAYYQFLENEANDKAELESLIIRKMEAHRAGFRKISFEGDSKWTIHILNDKSSISSWEVAKHATWCKKAIQGLEDCQFTHVRRSANKVADWLANKAISTKSSFVWAEVETIQVTERKGWRE